MDTSIRGPVGDPSMGMEGLGLLEIGDLGVMARTSCSRSSDIGVSFNSTRFRWENCATSACCGEELGDVLAVEAEKLLEMLLAEDVEPVEILRATSSAVFFFPDSNNGDGFSDASNS